MSNLWNITPHDSKKRRKCIIMYKHLHTLLEKSDDNVSIVTTILKTRNCDHILESGTMSILRSDLLNTIRSKDDPLKYISTGFNPWKKIFSNHVDSLLFDNMYISEYVSYRLNRILRD